MAGSRVPGGSLRAHASNTSKAKSSNIFGAVKPSAPKKFDSKKANDSSDSDSDDSSSSSDGSDLDVGTSSLANVKQLAQTPASQKKKTPVAKSKESAKAAPQATPSKPSTIATINGLASSIKKEKAALLNIKKEATSSSEEESSSESEDEEPKKVASKETTIKKSDSTSESESDSESDSSDGDTSSAGAKAASSKKSAPQVATKNVKSETTSEAESSSSESDSDSESESESEDESAKAKDVVAAQKKADTKPKTGPSKKASEPTKKAKASKATPEDQVDEDGDVEMVDQSTALTNGGKPTQVGDVPEFVAPDFHLRKLDGSANAADVANFFTRAQLEGKQVWYITAPASLPVTVVQDLTIPMDQAQKGLPVLSHNGDDYRMAFDNPAASSSFRLLIPNKNGDEYSLLERPVNQSMHFTRSETFPPGGPGSLVTTTRTVSTTKPARPQPDGLRARYTPLGVPTPKPTLTAPPASAPKGKGKAAAAAAAASSTTTAATPSKKKRKHRDDGEDGPVATAIHDTPVVSSSLPREPANKKARNAVKNTPAEKSNKKQKTSKSKNNENEEQQQQQQQQQRQSPVMTKKQTPIPLPQIPSFTTSASVSDADQTTSNTKAEQKTKTPKKQEEGKGKGKGKGKKKSETPVVVKTEEEKMPKKVTQILPPRFDSRGQPLH